MAKYIPNERVWQDDPPANQIAGPLNQPNYMGVGMSAPASNWHDETATPTENGLTQEAVTEASEREYLDTEYLDSRREAAQAEQRQQRDYADGDPYESERQRERRNRIAEGFAFALVVGAAGNPKDWVAYNAVQFADALIAELDK